MEQLRARYADAKTGSGHPIDIVCEEFPPRLTMWWIGAGGRHGPLPVTVVMKPTPGSFDVTTFIGADDGKETHCHSISEACALIDRELART